MLERNMWNRHIVVRIFLSYLHCSTKVHVLHQKILRMILSCATRKDNITSIAKVYFDVITNHKNS